MAFEEFTTEDSFHDFKGNTYMLVNVASMRARQINDGVEVYVRSRSRHPLQIALEEISSGYIGFTY
ncbi:MAG TPA: DNA-directed RNA polymerase subunit omega, partial [bacterium]|nr:DNA-directed RNA polymerase subunit omega [bacterium]